LSIRGFYNEKQFGLVLYCIEAWKEWGRARLVMGRVVEGGTGSF
jgi:hypothetical protein